MYPLTSMLFVETQEGLQLKRDTQFEVSSKKKQDTNQSTVWQRGKGTNF